MTAVKEFDPLAILHTLHRREVDFVVVGGIAAYLFGSNLPSANLDICFASDLANRQRLITAVTEMSSYLRDGSTEIDDEALQSAGPLTLKTDYGILRCVRKPLGTDGYEDLRTHAERVEIDGIATYVAGLEDLIRMKEPSNRPKDQYLLESLRATQRLRRTR
jgi:hypothetical protein